jgi:enoyl-CoA hydratase/carnithine racemase
VAVVTLDPGLLSAERTALDAVLADVVDGPTLVRFDGAWPRDASAARAAPDLLTALPALTVGVGAAPAALDAALDLVVPDAETADAVGAAFARAPLAAVSAALLLRHPGESTEAGLVAESTTYSMLQSGPEFQAWRARHDPSPAGDAATPRVRVDEHERITEIVLVRADRHNALDVAMRDQLHAALAEARWTPTPIVVRGEGPSFCSGGDLDEFATFPDPVHAHVVRLSRSLAASFAALAERLVVAVHGACLGAGIELPAFAAHVVAADDARIGLPEQAIGLVPGSGGTVSITRRAGRRTTLSLLLRDGTITAAEACDRGLVDHVVPTADLRARAFEIAESLA